MAAPHPFPHLQHGVWCHRAMLRARGAAPTVAHDSAHEALLHRGCTEWLRYLGPRGDATDQASGGAARAGLPGDWAKRQGCGGDAATICGGGILPARPHLSHLDQRTRTSQTCHRDLRFHLSFSTRKVRLSARLGRAQPSGAWWVDEVSPHSVGAQRETPCGLLGTTRHTYKPWESAAPGRREAPARRERSTCRRQQSRPTRCRGWASTPLAPAVVRRLAPGPSGMPLTW